MTARARECDGRIGYNDAPSSPEEALADTSREQVELLPARVARPASIAAPPN